MMIINLFLIFLNIFVSEAHTIFLPPLRNPQGGAKNAQGGGAKTILFLKIKKFDNKKIFILTVLMMYDDT